MEETKNTHEILLRKITKEEITFVTRTQVTDNISLGPRPGVHKPGR